MRYERVAITGGSGRIGRCLVRELAGRCALRILDRVAPGPDSDFRPVDVRDGVALLDGLREVDAVVHLAGHDLEAEVAPADFIANNVLGTFNVLQAAREAGVRRVVLCSSITATGLNEGRPDWPPAYLPVDEDHPQGPVHPYGLSKQLAEGVAASFVRAGLEVITLRPMLVMFPEYFRLVASRDADPATRWLFYHVSPADVARAFRAALEVSHARPGPYFVTAADSCRDEPTCDWLARMLGRLPEVRRPEIYRRHPRASVFDPSRARDHLGFEARDTWQDLNAAGARDDRSK